MTLGPDIVRAGIRAAEGARMAQLRQQCADKAQEMRVGMAGPQAQPQGQVALRGAQLAPREIPNAAELLSQLLEELGLYVMDYCEMPSRSSLVAVLLWIAHAAARDAQRDLIWWASPRLLLTSAENGSGKSTLLDLIGILLQSRAGRMVKVTPYGMAKILGAFKEVALPDDAQNTFGVTGEAAKDLLSIMLGSYSRGGTWTSGKSNATIEPVYGAVALAGKDALITKNAAALADLLARSVIIRMERPKRYMRQMDRRGYARGVALAKSLAAVMGALQGQLLEVAENLAEEAVGQPITEGDGGRTAEIFRPLEAIATVAGGMWAQAFAQAREELSAASGDLIGAENALAGIVGERTEGRNFWDEAV